MKASLSRLMALALVAGVVALLGSVSPTAADGSVTVTILHNNDGESRLLNAGDGLEDYGGAARFKALVDPQRAEGRSGRTPSPAQA